MVCTKTFSATTGTVYARMRKPKSELDRVVQMHSEGMTKAAIARVLSVSPSTVARWLERAAAHARRYHDAHTRLEEAVEVQLDELSCRGVGRAERVWAFSGLEVSSRLWVGLIVGTRTQRTTRIFVREVSDTLGAASAWTLYTTDSFKFYAEAIRHVFAGRPAVHVEIDNVYGRRGVVRTTWRRALGSKWAHEEAMVRNTDSKKPNTSFIERLNLNKRMCCSLLRRRNPAPARSPERIQEALELVRVIYNYVRVHSSLRTAQGKRTPAMVAGITKRPLRIREILSWVVLGAEARKLALQAQFTRA